MNTPFFSFHGNRIGRACLFLAGWLLFATAIGSSGALPAGRASAQEPAAPAVDGGTTAGTAAPSGYRRTLEPGAAPIAISQLDNDDGRPAVDFSGANYLVVWQDLHTSESMPRVGIYGRLVSTSGANMGSSFEIYVGTGDYDRQNPDVAFNAGGPANYLVVWEQDINSGDIYAHRVQQDGSLIDDEIAVATGPASEIRPAAAATGGEPVEWLVVYQSHNGLDYDIRGQRLNHGGTPTGPEILIAEGDTEQMAPDVAFDANTGRYLVVWQEMPSGERQFDIYARLIAADGSPVGGPKIVSANPDDQADPQVAADAGLSRFMVIWEQHPYEAIYSNIAAQMMTADGPVFGPAISLAEGGVYRRRNPAIAFHAGAEAYLAAWEVVISASNHDLYQRPLRPDGTLPGKESAVTTLTGMETAPALAPDHDLSFLLAWEDDRDAGSAGMEIYGQLARVNQLSGAVYAGEKGDLSTPIQGVTVSLGCSAYPDAIGNIVETDVSDDYGWFRLNAPTGCAYYNIVESDPVGYLSAGAAALDATVRNSNWIQYTPPLEGKIQHANQFFDRSAPLITVNFEEQAAGTYLTSHYASKQLFFTSDYQASYPFQEAPQVQAAAGAHTPSHVAVNTFSDTDLFSSRLAPMAFWFDQPMAVVNFQIGTKSVGTTACSGITAAVKAYDCRGNQVYSQNYSGVSPGYSTSVNIADSQGRIQRVVVDYGDTVCPEAIDTLTYQNGAAACTDDTPPEVSIISPPKNSSFNSPSQVIQVQITESGIVRFGALNGALAPLKMTDAGGVYRFNRKVTMSDGPNVYTAGAVNYSLGIGTDIAAYSVGAATTASLAELHLTQRGVVKAGACDIDDPFVAGKSGLARIKLDVRTAKGLPSYVTSVDMKLYRWEPNGFVLVNTIGGLVYPQSYDSFFEPDQMKQIIFPFSGKDVQKGSTYRFVFQPYVGAVPFGQPLEKMCGISGSGEYLFDETDLVRILVVPVEAGTGSPLLAGTTHTQDLYGQMMTSARTMPVRDYGGATGGVVMKETAPFHMCDGTAFSMLLYPDICLGTGFVWDFVDHDPGGKLWRADDEQVIDPNQDFCDAQDHIDGGRIKSTLMISYTFTPTLGIFRPGAHQGWFDAKHATPTDVDHDGDIDNADLALYIDVFYDSLQNTWLWFPSSYYNLGETFRFFDDTDDSRCNDPKIDHQAPIRVKGGIETILWSPQKAALDQANAGPGPDYHSALLAFPNIFVASDAAFGDIGSGVGWEQEKTVWLKVVNDDTMAHELGHSIAGLPDRYDGHDNWEPDDLAFKENAIAIYINGQEIAPTNTVVVMAGGANAIHYRPDYQVLFNKLKLYSGKRAGGETTQGPVLLVNGILDPDGQPSILSTRVSSELETTPVDPDGPYALVFGAGGTTLAEHRFHIGDPDRVLNPNEWGPPQSLFNLAAPLPDGTAWVELRRDGQMLARLAPSGHAPAVQLVYPNGGETFSPHQAVTVRWNSSDADGGSLTHDLYYSPDGGTTWELIAAGLGGSEYPWQLDAAAGSSSGRLKVIVSDGFKTGQDQSNASFTIGGHAPAAAVLSPQAGQEILACAGVQLRGAAFDLEGPVESIAWTLDGEQVGSTLEVDLAPLAPGEHALSLAVIDGDGMTAAHDVTFTTLADADCDGLSDAYENEHNLNALNYGDSGEDGDADGLNNRQEYLYGTDPADPDSDNDGFSDGREVQAHTDPTDPDSYPHYVIWMPVVRK